MRRCQVRRTSSPVRSRTASRTRSWYGSIESKRRTPLARTRFAARRRATCGGATRARSPSLAPPRRRATGPPATATASSVARAAPSSRSMRASSASSSRAELRLLLRPLERVTNELVDEQRVSLRLARDRSAISPCPHGTRSSRRRASSRASSSSSQSRRSVRTSPERREDRLGLRAAGGARGREEEQRGRLGGPEDLAEEREAVGVGPLEIVDDEDHRPPLGELREELAHGAEEARAHARPGPDGPLESGARR